MILKHQHFDILKKIVLERVIFKPPFKADASMHNEACFLYAVNGTSRLYSATENTIFNTGDGVVMKCGNYLNNWKRTSKDEQFEAIAIHFYPEVLKIVYEDNIPDFLKSPKKIKTPAIERIKINEMIEGFMKNILFYFENPSLVSDDLIKLKVKELILLLVNSDETGRVIEIIKDLFNPQTYEFKDIINSNLYEDLSVDDLALLTGMSTSSFKRKFNEIFKDSPARYIRNERLDKAAELLTKTEKRISDICYEVGFNDPANFTKSFSGRFKLSPSEYRNK